MYSLASYSTQERQKVFFHEQIRSEKTQKNGTASSKTLQYLKSLIILMVY